MYQCQINRLCYLPPNHTGGCVACAACALKIGVAKPEDVVQQGRWLKMMVYALDRHLRLMHGEERQELSERLFCRL